MFDVVKVSLRAVDDASRAALEALRVSEAQSRFFDGVRLSLEEADGYEPRPGAVELVTSVASYGDETVDRACPTGFYLRAGFEPTGEVKDREIVLRLDLAA